MADKTEKRIHLPGRLRIYNSRKSKDTDCPLHCLICNAEVATHNGYNILYTVLPNGGTLLCDTINKVLQRELDAVKARSTILCNKCFSLFDELDVAEGRCGEIRRQINEFYIQTAQIYQDEVPLSVRGVGSQTEPEDEVDHKDDQKDNIENQPPPSLEIAQPDIKLKISLSPDLGTKKRRGRPGKPKTQDTPKRKPRLKKSNVEKTEQSEEITAISSEPITKPSPIRKGRSAKANANRKKRTEANGTLNGILVHKNKSAKVIEKSSTEDGDVSLPATNTENVLDEVEKEEQCFIKVEVSNDSVTKPEMLSANDTKEMNTSGSADEEDIFFLDVPSAAEIDDDDDDFEWKEEPMVEIRTNYSSHSDDGNEKDEDGISGGEECSNGQPSGGRVRRGGGRGRRGRKRPEADSIFKMDRRGERAFMMPIHECDQCGKKWRTVTELRSHVASHSALRPFVCEICGQAYKMKKALDIHIGMHNGIHPFVCSYCNKSFTQKVGLEKHLPIHTGVTRFQCDLCGKRFIHQKSFNIHKMTHTGEKNIHCPVCKLAVFSQSHLKRHYRVHTGERPYGCNVCGKKFAEKYNLNAHARIHDPNSAGEGRRRCHTCPICGATYDRKHKMADHLSSVHCMWSTTQNEFKTEDYYNVEQTQLIQLQAAAAAAVSQQQPTQSSPVPQQSMPTHHHLSPNVLHQQQYQQSNSVSNSPTAVTHHLLVPQHHLAQHPINHTPALQTISTVFQMVPTSNVDSVIHHNHRTMPSSVTL